MTTWSTAAISRLDDWQAEAPNTRRWALRSVANREMTLILDDSVLREGCIITSECAGGSACDALDIAAEECIERLRAKSGSLAG